MIKKLFSLGIFLLAFVLVSGAVSAASVATIDNVIINTRVLAENKANIIPEAGILSASISLTSVATATLKIEAVLTNLNTGNTVADATGNFAAVQGQTTVALLNLNLLEPISLQRDYRLMVKVTDLSGKTDQKFYNIRFSGLGSVGNAKMDVSIDRTRVNGQLVLPATRNFIDETDQLSVQMDFTTIEDLNDARVEVVVKDSRTGLAIADATNNLNLQAGSSFSVTMLLNLIDPLDDSDSFEMIVNVVDVDGNSEKQSYKIDMDNGFVGPGGNNNFEVSIDRVEVNNQTVASSRINFIGETDTFNILVDITALDDLDNVRIEAILRDLNTNTVRSDTSPNFDLAQDASYSTLLNIQLIDPLDESSAFDLTIRVIDAEGNTLQQLYGLRMEDGIGTIGGNGRALDVSIDSVEVEKKVVAENENTFIIIGQGTKEIDARVRLTAVEDVEDGRIEAVLEMQNGNVVADTTRNFDMNDGDTSTFSLDLPLIGVFEQSDFRLRIKVIDAEGNFEEKVYGLRISQKEFPFIISSIALQPEDNVDAGKNLFARVNFKNIGILPLEGIKVKASIPELGVTATRFVDQLKVNGDEISQEFVLKIPDNAQSGTYTVIAEIFSQFGGESEVKDITFSVIGLNDQSQQVVNDRLVINVPVNRQNIPNDGTEVVYKMVLTNQGPDAETYTLLLDGGKWANLRLDDSNVMVLKPKESGTFNIFASTAAKPGEQSFLATVKSNGKVLSQIQLTGTITGSGKVALSAKLKSALKLIVIGVVVLLVAIGLFFGIRKYAEVEDAEEEYEQVESYY